MDNINGSIFHNNYLDYLSKCYATHYGIIVKPDIIWYTILCEIEAIVKSQPENYRHIFTDSNEKKDILVFTQDPVMMPIDSLIEEVFKLIPTGLKKEDILLNFSTTTKAETFAFSTSFLDAVSPYYNYMMYLCGFNKIKVLGTIEDYQMISDTLILLSVLFGSEMLEYLAKCKTVIKKIIDGFDDQNFWNDIFTVEQCGSGHQEEADGWFCELFNKKPSVRYVENFPTHISLVEYKNITTGKEFIMNSGILSSNMDGDYLIPNFEFYINEKTNVAKNQNSAENEIFLNLITKTIKSEIRNV
jgi:hypothetical protein